MWITGKIQFHFETITVLWAAILAAQSTLKLMKILNLHSPILLLVWCLFPWWWWWGWWCFHSLLFGKFVSVLKSSAGFCQLCKTPNLLCHLSLLGVFQSLVFVLKEKPCYMFWTISALYFSFVCVALFDTSCNVLYYARCLLTLSYDFIIISPFVTKEASFSDT